jgi:Ser/Thr protein kinase RdoA (MazF antagonist)
MIQREDVEPLSTRELAACLARCWTDGPKEFVRNFTNLVYRLSGTPTTYLRITAEAHRSPAQIASELELVRYLDAHGEVAASQPVRSRHGRYRQAAVAHNVAYSACVFEEAPGVSYADVPVAEVQQFFQAAGRTMGRLHAALACFEPPPDFV